MCVAFRQPDAAEFTHLDAVHTFTSGNDRRLNVQLGFYCEAGHTFEVEFAQQQGRTVVSTEETISE